jgi:hypothetical protein
MHEKDGDGRTVQVRLSDVSGGIDRVHYGGPVCTRPPGLGGVAPALPLPFFLALLAPRRLIHCSLFFPAPDALSWARISEGSEPA